MTKNELNRADILASSEERPDSLLDRWVAGTLSEELHEEVTVAILCDPTLRDEALLGVAMQSVFEDGARVEAPAPTLLQIAVRSVANAVEALAGSLQPVPVAAVAVRSAAGAEVPSKTFDIGGLAPGALLHVASAGQDRFRVVIDPAGPSDEADWVLSGPCGRRTVAAEAGLAVDFATVEAGVWTLEREHAGVPGEALRLRLVD